MQKLLTLWLAESTRSEKIGKVQEHLSDYLNNGWKVVSITAFGGTVLYEASIRGDSIGCFAIVIEK